MAAKAKKHTLHSRDTTAGKKSPQPAAKTVVVSPSPLKRPSPVARNSSSSSAKQTVPVTRKSIHQSSSQRPKNQDGGSIAVATVPAALFVLKVLLEKLKTKPGASASNNKHSSIYYSSKSATKKPTKQK